MAIKVDSVDVLKQYFSGVTERADHHATNVSTIIYTLLGVIVLMKDKGVSIEVRGSEDRIANILWVVVGGNRYAFKFSHDNGGMVEIRLDSYKGILLLSVNNSTSLAEILNCFRSVKHV